MLKSYAYTQKILFCYESKFDPTHFRSNNPCKLG